MTESGDNVGEWQTVPPRIYTLLAVDPDIGIYHEHDGAIQVAATRSSDGAVFVNMRQDSGGHLPQDTSSTFEVAIDGPSFSRATGKE